LNRKKRYGNLQGEQYVEWLASFAPLLRTLLKPNGSIVMEVGNAWEAREPTMSTLPLKALLRFLEAGELHLCQQFVAHNPARLPSPVPWVNIERIRVKDSYTHMWWMSPSARPQSDNRRVLVPYSKSMKKLLRRQSYNAGPRPSEYDIGDRSFLRDNSGAIPSNVLSYSNTHASDPYLAYCRKHGHKAHPARMPRELAEFFIKFLTMPGNVVLDPFAGSNMTGAAAERLDRKWIAIEARRDFIDASLGRFECATPAKLPAPATDTAELGLA
jgi:site-specific DNA-methyltransferase (cytosine-N4-specific)